MSEQAPERPVQQGPPKKENVFTRKIGPLPMWVWLALIAVAILLFVVFAGKKKSTQGQGKGQGGGGGRGGGFGRFLQPPIIFRRGGRGAPPHTRHHKRGDHDPEDEEDQRLAFHTDTMRRARTPGHGGGGPGSNGGGGGPGVGGSGGGGPGLEVGVDRRHKRGEPVPGELVPFRTATEGQTPPLADVANHYGTSPEAIVQEAEGRGYPNSNAWKRYVARHDWASPLPPATEFMILAHPAT